MSTIKIADIRKQLEENDLELLSITYKNLDTPLEVKCGKGHIFRETWKRLRDIPMCPICAEQAESSREGKIKRKKGYRVLAFDQATINTGWALYEDGKLIGHGVIKIPEKYATIDRYSQVNQEVKRRVRDYVPDLVLLEDIQLQESGSGVVGITTFKILAELLGILTLSLHDLGINYEVIPPASWRAHVGVKGRSRADKKKSGQLIVRQQYGLTIVNDEADAILLGRYGADKWGRPIEMMKW